MRLFVLLSVIGSVCGRCTKTSHVVVRGSEIVGANGLYHKYKGEKHGNCTVHQYRNGKHFFMHDGINWNMGTENMTCPFILKDYYMFGRSKKVHPNFPGRGLRPLGPPHDSYDH